VEYFDFIKPGELDELPEDPQLAFIEFVRIAQPRLNERIEGLNPSQEDEWTLVEDARYGFQNVVLGAAKKFRIEPFASLTMPSLRDFDANQFRQFRADLTHYITQIMLSAADQDRSDSVALPTKSTDSIRAYIFHLREAIEKAEHITDAKRAALLRRLDALEAELGRKRVRYLVIARVVIELLAIPGALAQTYDLIAPLATKILREIGEAKIIEDDEKRIPFHEPIALLPARPPEGQRKATKRRNARDFAMVDLDDEIPF